MKKLKKYEFYPPHKHFVRFLKRVEYKRYFLYLIRWQLSTPILAPIVAWVKHSPSILGTPEDWYAAGIANLIGGLIFFWVDLFIFKSQSLATQWEIKENIRCTDCRKIARGYRLVKTPKYDRTKDINPEFRCENCSMKKSKKLRERGISTEG